MKLISHRGNLEGKINDLENKPDYILDALNKGFEVEVDIWYHKKKLYLGHDEPLYKTDLLFLGDNRLWCHAKNREALEHLLQYEVRTFWHQEDDYTITSDKIIWQFPTKNQKVNKIYKN